MMPKNKDRAKELADFVLEFFFQISGVPIRAVDLIGISNQEQVFALRKKMIKLSQTILKKGK